MSILSFNTWVHEFKYFSIWNNFWLTLIWLGCLKSNILWCDHMKFGCKNLTFFGLNFLSDLTARIEKIPYFILSNSAARFISIFHTVKYGYSNSNFFNFILSDMFASIEGSFDLIFLQLINSNKCWWDFIRIGSLYWNNCRFVIQTWLINFFSISSFLSCLLEFRQFWFKFSRLGYSMFTHFIILFDQIWLLEIKEFSLLK